MKKDNMKLGNLEIIKINNAYFIINEWIKETYNGREHIVPKIKRQVNKEEYREILRINREKKLKRILED